ncbi:uncharacterized protein LOC119084830 [Bradysia coprophila]|uniref:uncharacterized protein LOC119084830 n=1 Tax=Bradysia coprophila TaxID=38358 RepID=UPI00187D81FC|nr:uncharacterized protein LOC119084830 [Bradysia coprophila]
MSEPSSSKDTPKPGILRLDIHKDKPRRSSGGSVEFRNQPELQREQQEPSISSTSSQNSGVKWAILENLNEIASLTDDQFEEVQARLKTLVSPQRKPSHNPNEKKERKSRQTPKTLLPIYMEPLSPLQIPDSDNLNSEDEDYSVSVSAVIQRRASTKGRRFSGFLSPRRTSSQMSHIIIPGDRRRSSVFTTSSGDTAISFGDGTHQESTKEQIFENIRLHKEVLQSVKLQPWSMRRKLRLVRQAKEYVARHEGALHERFAMSRSTKDLWARFKIWLAAKFLHWKREIENLSTVLIPWELRIKEIESHFGSVVASYFTFLRWLFWVNIVIAVVLTAFVVMPEFLASQWSNNKDDPRKNMLTLEKANATKFTSIWDFEGFLKYSPLFYGYYSDFSDTVHWHYDLPLAYFLTGLLVYIYSFWATLRKMAENSRTSKLSSKDDECVFSWKLFTGWDFMIGHAETAHNRIASVVLGFKEALLEEAEKKKDKRNWKVIVLRIIVNLVVINLLGVSAYAVVKVVSRSTGELPNDSYWRRNEITLVITSITFFFPMFFEVLGLLERYHPRRQLRMQLARIMVLNLLNLYALIFALFDKIEKMSVTSEDLKVNITRLRDEAYLATLHSLSDGGSKHLLSHSDGYLPFTTDLYPTPTNMPVTEETTAYFDTTTPMCRNVSVRCDTSTAPNQTMMIAAIASILLSSTMRPEYMSNPTTAFDVTDQYGSSTEAYDYSTEYSTGNSTDYPTTAFDGNATRRFKRETDDDDYEYYDNAIADLYAEIQEGTYSSTSLNGNESDIFATISTILDNIRSTSSTDDNMADYERFVSEKVTEYYESTATEETCFAIVCDTTLSPSSDESTSPSSDASSSPSSDASTSPSSDAFSITDTTSERYEQSETKKDMYEPTVIEPDGSSKNSTNNSTKPKESLIKFVSRMDEAEQLPLRKLCWETMFGQELVKLTVMDLVATVGSIIFVDFFRALFVRFFNKCWFWDLEKRFPKYGDFKIAENILHLVNNQGQVWMGMFFSPGLAILNLVKLVIIMYLRSWTVLTCNVPHEVVFRASRSNNFYLALLLTMLFLCVLPVGYAIVWLRPSWHCGPFSNYDEIYLIFTDTLKKVLSKDVHEPLKYISSPSTVIPLLLLLILIIYYLVSVTNALREANQDLRLQLQRERTEGRKKMLKIGQAKTDDTGNGGAMDRWRKVLEASSPLTPSGTGAPIDQDEVKIQARKELLARIMRKALRKSSVSEDDSIPLHPQDDETDTEQHDSLPHDYDTHHSSRKKSSGKKSRQNSIDEKKPATATRQRKSSTSRLKDIVQVAAAKKDLANEHPSGRYKIDKVINTQPRSEQPKPPQYRMEPDTDQQVVSERRRSLLRRQGNLVSNRADIPTIPSESSQEKQNISYEIINERNQEVELRAKSQSQRSKLEPEIFRFDRDDIYRNDDISDDDNTSYKEIEFPKVGTSSHESKSQSSNEICWNQNVPDDIMLGIDDSEAKHSASGSSTPEYATVVKRKPAKLENISAHKGEPTKPIAIDSKSTTEKPKRRFNSFLALVREAVSTKKQENLHDSADTSVDIQDYDELVTEESESLNSRKGSRKIYRFDAKNKRNDSSSSLWSDNIPVITISKTESDECILEGNSNESLHKAKKNGKPEEGSVQPK